MDIMSGIAAATQAIEIAKTLRGIEKEYDAATYRAQIAELIDSLTDAKLALSDAKETIAHRNGEIERLKASFQTRAKLTKGEGDYDFMADEHGKPLGYPVCPKCENIEGRVVQLKEHELSGTGRCPVCASIFRPVVCYLPQGSGFRTKQEKEEAEWDARMERSRIQPDNPYF